MPPKTKNKIRKILSWIAIGSFIIFGTSFIVLYSRGYRFDRDHGTLGKSGVLDVTAKPTRNDLYLNGVNIGKTPKTVASIREGFHLVEVRRDGYNDWKSTIEIIAEKSTPIFPILFRSEPKQIQSWAINGNLIDKQAPKFTNYIFIITEQSDEQLTLPTPEDPSLTDDEPTTLVVPDTEANPDQSNSDNMPTAEGTEIAPTQISSTEQKLHTYKVWRYDTNPSFWNANQNPVEIYSEQLSSFGDTKPKLTLYISENGEEAILSIQEVTDPNTTIPPVSRSLLLDTQAPNEQPKLLPIDQLLADHILTWAKDNDHLILSNESEILSFNTVNLATTLLLRNSTESPTIPWSTDINGNFYYIDKITDDKSGLVYQQIHQMLLTGQSPSILVDRIYFSDKTDLLLTQEELIDRDELYTFSNSPQSTQFVGEITQLTVENDIDSLILNTQYAMYMLDLQTDRYTLLSAVPAAYEKLSPNEESLLMTSENWLYIFNFDKEEADHTTELGLIGLLESEDLSSFRWHPSSRVIFYASGDKVQSIDITAENAYDLADTQDNFFLSDQSGENLYILDRSEENIVRLIRVVAVD